MIRRAGREDAAALAALAVQMWTSHVPDELAAELLRACEQWAKEQGCTEFASDCELDNADSLRFHLAMGFLEANRIICFTKQLQTERNECGSGAMDRSVR